MKNKQTINIEKALEEKRTMQKNFIREHGYPSSVLILVIEHFEEMKKMQTNGVDNHVLKILGTTFTLVVDMERGVEHHRLFWYSAQKLEKIREAEK